MNVDADYLVERFCKWMEDGTEVPIQEGRHLAEAGISLSVGGVWINSHYMHKLRVHVQGKKHQKYLEQNTNGRTMTGTALTGRVSRMPFSD